jgi:hypothetical protein
VIFAELSVKNENVPLHISGGERIAKVAKSVKSAARCEMRAAV